jgi:MFS transporter, DHA2 family, multidrug resistance protein
MASSAITAHPPVPAAPAAAGQAGLTPKRIAAFVALSFGMFMAILDIQIVASSLSEIQAGLSASADEISWVQTSYLVAEIIMIPLSGYLGRLLSTRYLFALSAAGFTLASVMCSTSTSIGEMMVWRALQGFIGGGMIPAVFAAAYTIFPRNRQGGISAVIGLVATLAPTIGPTIGGYLTSTFSWHWLFLVNVPPGIAVTIAVLILVDFDEPDFSLLDQFDFIGVASLAVFLGSLEYFLEEGPRYDWLQDSTIIAAGLACVIGGIVFFSRVLTTRYPVVDLRAFVDRNFATGSVFSFSLGIGLYGLVYLYPMFLARVRGYDALQIGETMAVTGAAMMLSAPLVGRIAQRIDPRVMIAAGLGTFAFSCFELTPITKDWSFWELFVPQALRGVALMSSMVPINMIALGTLPPERLKNASGLYNLTRNLGGAVGLAVISTLLNHRWDLHLSRLRESVTWGRVAANEELATLAQGFAAHVGLDAQAAALQTLANMVRREALVMAFSDVFLVLAFVFASLVLLVPLVRRPRRAPGPGEAH